MTGALLLKGKQIQKLTLCPSSEQIALGKGLMLEMLAF